MSVPHVHHGIGVVHAVNPPLEDCCALRCHVCIVHLMQQLWSKAQKIPIDLFAGDL